MCENWNQKLEQHLQSETRFVGGCHNFFSRIDTNHNNHLHTRGIDMFSFLAKKKALPMLNPQTLLEDIDALDRADVREDEIN